MPVDPQVEQLLANMVAQGVKSFEQMSVDECRAVAAVFIEMEGPVEEIHRTKDYSIIVNNGQIPVRVYYPTAANNLPVVVYYHGGGFVFGDLDVVDKVARCIAKDTGAAVVSVGYRKAPEHKFPTAHEDAYAALLWVYDNAFDLNVDQSRIAVMGDSAGGNIATAVAHMARDHHGPALKHQALVYPLVDPAGDYPSKTKYSEGYLLTSAALGWFAGHYLNNPGEEVQHPYMTPLKANLKDLPSTTIITAEYDPLTDEGEAYASALRKAGVGVNYYMFPGMVHGFFWMKGVINKSGSAFKLVNEKLKAALNN
ncbi:MULTISPECIES: alpha/beta hydrolase [unclassified Limnobacter]|uniref:alpha/beta hydrolase n=1 Tax=unclassified Limnobacter TaxID=2630203 RepID=UPI0012F0599B|nr:MULTISPECIES: alpha/beta hydrolase [unclassified Limnobacter]VWX34093.1 Lipase [Limnobacter sp. 130]